MRQPYDENGNPVATVRLGTCEEIDGSGGSAVKMESGMMTILILR